MRFQTAEDEVELETFEPELVAQIIRKIIDDKMIEMIPSFVDQVRVMEDLFVKTQSPEAEFTGQIFAIATIKLLEIKYGEVNPVQRTRVRHSYIRGKR